MAVTPARQRVRKSRERKRRGVIPVEVEVSTLEIDFLRWRGMARESHATPRCGETYQAEIAMGQNALEPTVAMTEPYPAGLFRLAPENFRNERVLARRVAGTLRFTIGAISQIKPRIRHVKQSRLAVDTCGFASHVDSVGCELPIFVLLTHDEVGTSLFSKIPPERVTYCRA